MTREFGGHGASVLSYASLYLDLETACANSMYLKRKVKGWESLELSL